MRFSDVSSIIRRFRSYRHLEGIKPNPNPNPKTKLLEPDKYHFPNGLVARASRHFIYSIIDSREQGLATLRTVVLFYTVFTGYASGLELTPC